MTYFVPVSKNDGVNTLSQNPCKLLDFNLVSLNKGESYSAESNTREVVAVILGGTCTITVNDKTYANIGARADVFSGKPYSVYIPVGARYTIEAISDVQVGLPSAPSDLETDPYLISPDLVTSGVWGRLNFTRNFHQILTQSGQPDLPAARLIIGETFTPSGNWSTYPSHKHEVDNLPTEAYHEEMYYFKVDPTDGFGITRFYHDEADAVNYTVKDSSILMIPDGYHTYVGAPGFQSYYLWFLAGEHREQAVLEDIAQKIAVANL